MESTQVAFIYNLKKNKNDLKLEIYSLLRVQQP